MAQPAADLGTLCNGSGPAVVNREGPVRRRAGKYGALKLASMAGLAGSRRSPAVPEDSGMP